MIEADPRPEWKKPRGWHAFFDHRRELEKNGVGLYAGLDLQHITTGGSKLKCTGPDLDAAAIALHARMEVDRFAGTDLAYAPPFSPVRDPLLVAARALLKQM